MGSRVSSYRLVFVIAAGVGLDSVVGQGTSEKRLLTLTVL